MGSPWQGVLEEVEAELRRTAQRLRGTEVLAPRISVRLPESEYSRWAPVLPEIVQELGTELVRWAERRGASWFGDRGPLVAVELTGTAEPEIDVEFPTGEAGAS